MLTMRDVHAPRRRALPRVASLGLVTAVAAVATLGFQGQAFALATPPLTAPLPQVLPGAAITGESTSALATPLVVGAGEAVPEIAGGAAVASGGVTVLATAATVVPVAIIGAAAIYGAWKLGNMLADDLNNNGDTPYASGPSDSIYHPMTQADATAQGRTTIDPSTFTTHVAFGDANFLFWRTDFTDSAGSNPDFPGHPVIHDAEGSVWFQCQGADSTRWIISDPNIKLYGPNHLPGNNVLQAMVPGTDGSIPLSSATQPGTGQACASVPFAIFRLDTIGYYRTASDAVNEIVTVGSEDRSIVFSDGSNTGNAADIYWWQKCQGTDGSIQVMTGQLDHPAAAGEDLTFPECMANTHRIEGEMLSGWKLLAHFKLPPGMWDPSQATGAGGATVAQEFVATGSVPLAVSDDPTHCTYGPSNLTIPDDCNDSKTSETTPTPTPTPDPTCTTDCGDPGSNPIPPTGGGGSCFPSGWGVFNPVNWIEQPVKCALQWAFVPPDTFFSDQIQQLKSAFDDTAIGSLFGAVTNIFNAVGNLGGDGSCAGPGFSLDKVPYLNSTYVVHPFNACDGIGKVVTDTTRPLVSIGYWLTALYVGLGVVGKAFGVEFPWSGGDAEGADPTEIGLS